MTAKNARIIGIITVSSAQYYGVYIFPDSARPDGCRA